ncbi:hypothetical protein BDV25DRAFT_55747 [Aspergillus avenaceus]|uniref:rRNA-processing protein EFG1 n=1 Tax=Aspergillus avenaceus TaxID=36643 RepID=A0A5N6TIB9_ASPAV|nr:hypothetical protein BDV25DRAFT_55747 [Aspergillus avenaceus]
MPREYSRSQSPVSQPTGDRHYRDRSDRPKRRHGSDEASHPYARKKIQLPKKEHKYPSVNELKRRIRDSKRLLNRVDLPADARIVQERALAGYEKDLEEETLRRDRSQMIKKYHFVRFLDRKTAAKDVKRLERREKEISDSDIDADAKEQKLSVLAQKLHTARVNLNYTIYYPLTEKYIALYADGKKKDQTKPTNDDEDGDAGYKLVHATAAERPAMWPVVEQCMKDGTLGLLRDGKLNARSGKEDARAEPKKASNETKKNKETATKASANPSKRDDKKAKSSKPAPRDNHRSSRAPPPPSNDDGDDSDGGFFEM